MARRRFGVWTWAGLIAWLAVLVISIVSYARNWGASKVVFRAITEGGFLAAFFGFVFFVAQAVKAGREEKRSGPGSDE